MARLTTPPLLVLFGLAVAAIMQVMRNGATPHVWFLLVGSVLSAVAIVIAGAERWQT